MTERKYSVAEIGRMRSAIEAMQPEYGAHLAPNQIKGFGIGEGEFKRNRDARVEDHLRTYIANGTEPEELETAISNRNQTTWG